MQIRAVAFFCLALAAGLVAVSNRSHEGVGLACALFAVCIGVSISSLGGGWSRELDDDASAAPGAPGGAIDDAPVSIIVGESTRDP